MPVPTLAYLLAENLVLPAWISGCHRHQGFDVPAFIAKLGGDNPVPALNDPKPPET